MTLKFFDRAAFIAAGRLILDHYEAGKIESISLLADADQILRINAVYYAGYADESKLPGLPCAKAIVDEEATTAPAKGQNS